MIKALSQPDYLHIASHGFFEESPSNTFGLKTLLSSGIYLSGAETALTNKDSDTFTTGEHDGILTAYEAMNLNLQGTKLVTLSACDTGLGKIRSGKEYMVCRELFKLQEQNPF